MAIPYSRPRGAIHSLAHISELSASRNRLLCVSDRTLYLLHNLAALDITMQSRWVEEFSLEFYTAVSADSPGFDLYRDSVNAFQLEVLDMSCDIVASLAEIRDAILQIQSQNQVLATVCCSYAFDPSTYYEADPGTGSPPDKCLLSYAYALAWADAEIELYHQWAVGGIFPSIGVLAAILDEFDLPGQTLLAIVSLGASNVLPMLESLWAIAVNNLITPVTCAVYNAVDTAAAKVAVLDAIEASGATGTALELLKAPITHEGLNKVFDGTFGTEGVIAPDCDELCVNVNCGGPRFDIGCDPGDEGECGSGDLSPGLARTWTATHDSGSDSYAIYARIDTNRLVTIVSAPGWAEKPGQPPCRWFGCFGDPEMILLGSADEPLDMPIDTCLGLLVVIGINPFALVVNIGDVCIPEVP